MCVRVVITGYCLQPAAAAALVVNSHLRCQPPPQIHRSERFRTHLYENVIACQGNGRRRKKKTKHGQRDHYDFFARWKNFNKMRPDRRFRFPCDMLMIFAIRKYLFTHCSISPVWNFYRSIDSGQDKLPFLSTNERKKENNFTPVPFYRSPLQLLSHSARCYRPDSFSITYATSFFTPAVLGTPILVILLRVTQRRIVYSFDDLAR